MVRKILDVPKIKQLPGYCGPASLAMVFSYNGLKINQKDLAQYFREPEEIEDFGVDSYDIATVARKFGFVAHVYKNMGFEDIIKFINYNLPIISICKIHKNEWSLHYYVVKGYDDSNFGRVFVNNPSDLRKNSFEFPEFKELWEIYEINQYNNCGIVVR